MLALTPADKTIDNKRDMTNETSSYRVTAMLSRACQPPINSIYVIDMPLATGAQ
jgi:hypothetical protein